MFNGYNYRQKDKFIIDSNFPKEVLVKIMKPYLLLHVQSLHSLVTTTKMYASSTLIQKLLALHNFNPNFGRKIMYPVTKHGFGKSKVIYKHCFNDKRPPFHKHSNDFLSSHTTLNCEYNDENDMPQIMNTLEYAIINVEIYPDEIDESDDDDTHGNEVISVANAETNAETNDATNESINADDNDNDSQSNYQEPDDNSIS
jgi:hypothetical protein